MIEMNNASRAENTNRVGSARPSEDASYMGSSPRWPTAVAFVLIVAVNCAVFADVSVPFVSAAVGFWFIFLHPVYLLCTTSLWSRCSIAERVGYCLGVVLLTLMLAGLVINTLLPAFRVSHPLGPVPVAIIGDLVNVTLYLYRRRHPAYASWLQHFFGTSAEEARTFVVALLSVAFAILGANRLNNGAGDQVSLACIGLVALVMSLELIWAAHFREGAICVTIYLVSFALLLTTSLRGWYVTGHDIQNEYRAFQLTSSHGRWDMLDWHNAYNACLSITILPTELSRVVPVDDPYIYKFFFQSIFAFVPVLVYAISRRYLNRKVALLAVIYFIGFPTFFTDMPFLNRQEIAYLFVCLGILAATNPVWRLHTRQLAMLLAGVGIEVSHYSSMYIFVGIVALGWATRRTVALVGGLTRPQRAAVGPRVRWAPGVGRTTSLGCVAALVAIVFVWGGLVTQTSGQVFTAAGTVVSAISGHSGGAKSGNVSYSPFGGRTLSPASVLQQFRRATFTKRDAAPEAYLDLPSVSRASTPVVPQAVLGLTGLGRALSSVGLPVKTINAVTRNIIAYAEQLFIVVGIVGLFFARKRRRDVGEEFFWLCVGGILVVGLITVLPSISANYGVLRAFQQALIEIAPVVVIGSLTVLSPLGRPKMVLACASVLCLALFANTTNLIPQMLGGNVPELNLNNKGLYYDVYYMHPQEEAAINWLSSQRDVLSDGVQASYTQDKFAFTDLRHVSGSEVISDIYPTLVRRSSWLILDYSIIHTGTATTSRNGNLIQYRYPVAILRSNKNLVYSDGGAEVYK